MPDKLTFGVLEGKYAINQLEPDSEIPQATQTNSFVCIVRTSEELSIVAREEINISAKKIDSGWRCFFIKGNLSFKLIGILAKISRLLADANVSIFAISTYNTDYILVKDFDFDKAHYALLKDGHQVEFKM